MKSRTPMQGLGPLALAVGLWCAACGGATIPNTDVEDTPDNRGVITFCEQYRRAVEKRDIPALVELASPEYYEDGGNIDASDDIDHAGLKDYLTSKFGEASGIRYEIRYRRVVRERDLVFVDYTFSASYRVLEPTTQRERWKSAVEENRLELVPAGESFLIVAGM